jgi:Integrase core domain.
VTDKGACFTAEAFQAAVTRHGLKPRFGAVGRHGSIALIERLGSASRTFSISGSTAAS